MDSWEPSASIRTVYVLVTKEVWCYVDIRTMIKAALVTIAPIPMRNDLTWYPTQQCMSVFVHAHHHGPRCLCVLMWATVFAWPLCGWQCLCTNLADGVCIFTIDDVVVHKTVAIHCLCVLLRDHDEAQFQFLQNLAFNCWCIVFIQFLAPVHTRYSAVCVTGCVVQPVPYTSSHSDVCCLCCRMCRTASSWYRAEPMHRRKPLYMRVNNWCQ